MSIGGEKEPQKPSAGENTHDTRGIYARAHLREKGEEIIVMQIMLLACSVISVNARRELMRAECPIHTSVVAGYEGMSDVLIVELQYGSAADLHVLSVWDHPTEIQIESRDLNLYRAWHAPINGYALVNLDEAHDVARALSGETVEDEPVAWGDLDEHPF